MPEYLREAGMQKNHKLAWFRCHCGAEFKARKSRAKDRPNMGCGCSRGRIRFGLKYSGSIVEQHSHENRWKMMKQRCYNPNHTSFKNYGARGITICTEWLTSFDSYCKYINALPDANKIGLTVDRIDNDKNYEPGNLQWATPVMQSWNSRRW